MNEDQENKSVESESTSTSTEPTDKTPEIKTRKFRPSKKHISLVLTGLVLIALSSGATWFVMSKNKPTQNNNKTPDNTGRAELPKEANIETVKSDLNFTWQAPKPVAALPIFDNLDAYYKNNPLTGDGTSYVDLYKYFLVGTSNDGSKAYVTTFPPFLDVYGALFIVEKDGKYTIFQQLSSGDNIFSAESDGAVATYHGPKISSNTTIDQTSIISAIEPKKEINYKGQTLNRSGGYNGLDFLETSEPKAKYNGSGYTKLGEIAEGTLYEYISNDDPSYKISNFYLVYKNHMAESFIVSGELSKSKIDPITWSDNTKNTDDYASVGRGCGLSGANEVAKGVSKDQLEQIGKSDKGQPVFGFKSASAILVDKHYKEYNPGDDSNMDGFYAEGDKGLSLDQFLARRPIYLVEDSLGRWLVFSNLRYVPQGGCAKPVVYLYPTENKRVDVSVDADVTVSDPLYGKNGWRNVLARPDGKLTFRGKNYDSLFWEGYSKGVYPEVNKGVIVEKSKVIETWQTQLNQLGLNQKEISDFTAFWEDRIPNNHYVRISWLTTGDMQRLAPLYVTGGVETTIRVFLDMEGLQEPYTIEPQLLGAPKRTDFTVIEWGGLVRDGSVPKLQ